MHVSIILQVNNDKYSNEAELFVDRNSFMNKHL